MGRPVGVEIARDGALLVADDVGGTRVARERGITPHRRRLPPRPCASKRASP